MPKKFIIGTRGSLLALTQADQTRRKLEELTGHQYELKIIKTQGDLNQKVPLWQLEGQNFFTKELPKAFGGGALQRNTQHSTASDLYVMGDLLSDFEIHPAMRSQPLHQNFAYLFSYVHKILLQDSNQIRS